MSKIVWQNKNERKGKFSIFENSIKKVNYL